MRNHALLLFFATAACSADADIEIAGLGQELASCNSREDCTAPPGRCEEVDFCEGVCYTHDKAGCRCEVSTECNDGNPCTQDSCGEAGCAHLPITDGPGCCATVASCPAPNACQVAACAQSQCSYHSNGHPGCCNTNADCDGTACVDNTCGGASPQADVSITNTDSPDPASVGQAITYTLVVHNAGPAPATGVMVTDGLPAGATLLSPAAPPCSGTGPVTCSLGTLAAGADVTVTLVVTVPAAGTATSSATVTSDHDPASANNVAIASTAVTGPAGCSGNEQCASNQTCMDGACRNLACECGSAQDHQCVAYECAPECAACGEGAVCGEDHHCHASTGGADLGLSWGNLPSLILPGEELTFALTVTNHGPDAATQIPVTLAFPTPPKTPLPNGCVGAAEVVCTIPALAVDAAVTLAFHSTAKSGVSVVSATVPNDSNVENDSATLHVAVVSENPGAGSHGDGPCGCGDGGASVAGPVPGGLFSGAMVLLVLLLGRRRR